MNQFLHNYGYRRYYLEPGTLDMRLRYTCGCSGRALPGTAGGEGKPHRKPEGFVGERLE